MEIEMGCDRGEMGAGEAALASMGTAASRLAAARGGLGLRRCELLPRALDRPRGGVARTSCCASSTSSERGLR